MQIQVENFALLANVISQAKNIYIMVAKDADEDQLSAAIFLEENLTALNKKVLIIAPGNIPESLRFFAAKIANHTPTKKLVVSFNWRKNEIEKVAYNLEGENFNFVINPRNKKINTEEIKIYHSGDEPDLIITLGIESPSEITGLDREVLESKTIVNIDKKSTNEGFGSLNFVHPDADSISAIIAVVSEKSNLLVKAGSADLLMRGIKFATSNFKEVKDSVTFEAAAYCTKLSKSMQQKPQEKSPIQAQTENLDTDKLFRAKQITN
ncbi:MAG: hypothetical protein A3A57_01035 [Candidatus Woykebacteria bacterium RIFCSPLOWO2_01_FULL_41_12]|uniref:Uncharacterized protein n=1 Tax=Candidatus Woykebacteria bacterium RIFCSPLOWO2_01_FULL_41_12 TaxID=1802604 RepID=A0A1G1WY95_9BACT|nr:MAG: hypothetical protein A3A57_01035 [Candidatus Woykebacteria bacterium RIFCSPLOWO2_01_FULL_41_12]